MNLSIPLSSDRYGQRRAIEAAETLLEAEAELVQMQKNYHRWLDKISNPPVEEPSWKAPGSTELSGSVAGSSRAAEAQGHEHGV